MFSILLSKVIQVWAPACMKRNQFNCSNTSSIQETYSSDILIVFICTEHNIKVFLLKQTRNSIFLQSYPGYNGRYRWGSNPIPVAIPFIIQSYLDIPCHSLIFFGPRLWPMKLIQHEPLPNPSMTNVWSFQRFHDMNHVEFWVIVSYLCAIMTCFKERAPEAIYQYK